MSDELLQPCYWLIDLLRKSKDVKAAKAAINSDYTPCPWKNRTMFPLAIFYLFYLLLMLVNFENLGQFWKLHVLRFPKLSLILKIDHDLQEIYLVKDS